MQGRPTHRDNRPVVELTKYQGTLAPGSEIRVASSLAPQGGFVARFGDVGYEAHTVRVDRGRDTVVVRLDRPYDLKTKQSL